MKIVKYIFIPLFLMVMLFTVVQYIPLLEEENSTHIELAKKNKESKESSEGENDTNEDNADNYFICDLSYLFDDLNAIRLFNNERSRSLLEFKEISTPPPKAV